MNKNLNCISKGRALINLCTICLISGKAIITILPPQYRNAGLSQELLYILVPIWSIGILGILLVTFGWVKNPICEPKLERRIKLSKLTKGLGAFTSLLVAISMLTLVKEIETPIQFIAIYSMMTCAAFIFYLCTFYIEKEDPVTTTYINSYQILFAILCIPLLWPFLLVLKKKHNQLVINL